MAGRGDGDQLMTWMGDGDNGMTGRGHGYNGRQGKEMVTRGCLPRVF